MQIQNYQKQYGSLVDALATGLTSGSALTRLGDAITTIRHYTENSLPSTWITRSAENVDSKIMSTDKPGLEMAALVLTVLTSKNLDVRPALGWSGFNRLNSLNNQTASSKLQSEVGSKFFPQKQINLVTHSGMRVPSDKLLNETYIGYILGQSDYHFGKYPK